MIFPPINADRCLLWITLARDETAVERYAALRAALKSCRLHPLDTTPSAELVIVKATALDAHLDMVRAALGPDDMLHRIDQRGGRLQVTVIAAPSIMDDPLTGRPPGRRPPWRQ